jgi:hypothetical protein
MDSYTLSLVVIIFLLSLGLYLGTTTQVVLINLIPPTPPLPEKRADRLELLDIKIPPVLRQNVAVARLVRMQS